MADIIYAGRIEKGRQYVEMAGLSTETKPTDGILGGSKFHEMDTTKIFAFDRVNDLWRFQMQLGEPETPALSSSLNLGNQQLQPAVQQPGGFQQGLTFTPEDDVQEDEENAEEPEEPENPEDGEEA